MGTGKASLDDDMILSIDDAKQLVENALIANKTSQANAASVAAALVSAEIDGHNGHGLSRVNSYAAQARVGKIDGHATPTIEALSPSALRINGHLGFAYPAIDLAFEQLEPKAKKMGIAIAVVNRSHHFGQAGAHVERLANKGLIALALANTPKAMAFWGGHSPQMGTNPIAFACPSGAKTPPLVIDLALSIAARGKIIAAEQKGVDIPNDWALDASGNPTTKPDEALYGTLLPIGGAKGAALALMVEILVAGLSGSHFGWQASSFLDDKGPAPNMGQLFIALEPNLLSNGAFPSQMAELLHTIDGEDGVRLPGTRRLSHRVTAHQEGLKISPSIYQELNDLAAGLKN